MPRMGFGTSGITEVGIIESAISQAGYRHLDTASRYENEDLVGQAVQNCIARGEIQREDIFITTKLWHNEYQDPEAALRRSLSKLQLDQVDLYLIHWPCNSFSTPKVPMHVLWPKMERLKELGLTKAIGVSNFNT